MQIFSQIDQFIRENHLSIQASAELTGIDKESFCQILKETFKMKNLEARFKRMESDIAKATETLQKLIDDFQNSSDGAMQK